MIAESLQFKTILIRSSSAAVLAALSDRLGPHGFAQVSTLIKSSSAAICTDLAQTHVALTGPTKQQLQQQSTFCFLFTSTQKKSFTISRQATSKK